MKNDPKLKHVRFNQRKNTQVRVDAYPKEGRWMYGKKLTSINYDYIRTPGWSDQNHLCRTDYYHNLILKECTDGCFMENIIDRRQKTEEIHNIYGTYIFGIVNDGQMINHLNGRHYILDICNNNFTINTN